MPHWIFHEVRKFVDNSSRENQNTYCQINKFLQESNLWDNTEKYVRNMWWMIKRNMAQRRFSFSLLLKNLTQSSILLTMAHISAIRKRTPCCFSITALLILAILYNEKTTKSNKLAWQQKTIKRTNCKHESIPHFQGGNSLLLVRWEPLFKG